jgi:hypothetical protein
MRRTTLFVAAVAVLAAAPRIASAQGITPQIGVYVPGNDLDSLKAGATQVRVNKEGSLALGLNLDFGGLRASLAYASAAKLNQQGISGQSQVGEGKLLAIAGDLVLRPLPRIVVQPYLLLGAGLRRADYDFDSDGLSNAFPENDTDFALHAGVGADLNLGPIGVAAELTDFISKDSADKWKQHDGFGFVGLKLRF